VTALVKRRGVPRVAARLRKALRVFPAPPERETVALAAVERERRTRVVNQAVDWLTVGFRVELEESVMLTIGAALAKTKTHGRAEVELWRDSPFRGRWRESWRAEIRASGRDAALLTTPRVRVLVSAKAPGGADAGEAHVPGWTVEVTATNDLLQREGARAAVAEMWRTAEWFGKVLDARLRRIDMCVDLVGFDFDPKLDVDRIVKRSRAKVKPYTVHGNNFDLFSYSERVDGGRSVLHLLGSRFEGITVSPGNPVSLVMYDKTHELRVGQNEVKRDVLRAVWLANEWKGERVDRVEFHVRGEALDELGMRGATEQALLAHLDTLWHYLARRWFRMVQRTAKQLSRCPNDPRWDVVQAVEWTDRALTRPDVRRVRRSFGARAAQAVGCAVSLMVAAGDAPNVAAGWVTPDGEVWDAREQARHLTNAEAADILRRALGAVFRRAGEHVFRAALDKHRSPAEALEHFMVRYRATRARLYVPGLLSEEASTEKGDPACMRGRILTEAGQQRLRLVS
jgi:hypothetical protein